MIKRLVYPTLKIIKKQAGISREERTQVFEQIENFESFKILSFQFPFVSSFQSRDEEGLIKNKILDAGKTFS